MLRMIFTLVRDFMPAGSGTHCRACRAAIRAADGYGLSEGVCCRCRAFARDNLN
jgi:hypothetical protein